jgi:hypothetical protein
VNKRKQYSFFEIDRQHYCFDHVTRADSINVETFSNLPSYFQSGCVHCKRNVLFLLIAIEQVAINTNVSVFGIWNTTAGQDSMATTPGYNPGQYWPDYSPANVFDGNRTTPYASYGTGNFSYFSLRNGVDTGVYVTVPGDPFYLTAFRVVRAHVSVNRDPLTMTVEGSNQSGSALILGSSWTLIYNGSSGLDISPSNDLPGTRQILYDNVSLFSSYRFIFTSKRSLETCVEITEIEMFKSIWINHQD